MLKDLFQTIGSNYLKDNDTYNNRLPRTQKNLISFDTLKSELPNEFEKLSKLDKRFKFKGSQGASNMPQIPHICLFDIDITESAQTGYYIAYLFDATLSEVYMSLNQGWTQYEEQYGLKIGRVEITKTTKIARKCLRSIETFSFDPINLNSKGHLAKGYMLGNICSRKYIINSMPDDAEIIDDLRNMIGVYKELKGIAGISILDIQHRASEEAFQKIIQMPIMSVLAPGPIALPEKAAIAGRLSWRRSAGRSSIALMNANYICENDPKHETFISRKSERQFVEAHHLIPLEFQGYFKYSLDVPENIIALCPNCHKFFHLGLKELCITMIEKFWVERIDKLNERGIGIDIRTLIEWYCALIEEDNFDE